MKNCGLPEAFYPIKMANAGKQLRGSINLSSFARLRPSLASDSGVCQFECQGRLDAANRPVIDLKLSTTLVVTCQACMDELSLPIEHQITLCAVVSESQIEQIDREYEPALVDDDGKLDLLAMLEDELILSVPVAPVHEESCISTFNGEHIEEDLDEDEVKPNPFSVLETLKKTK